MSSESNFRNSSGDPEERIDYAKVEWLVDAIREREGITPEMETRVRLSDGARAFRVPGKPGLQFTRFAIFARKRPVLQAATGEPITIEVDVEVTKTGEYKCFYVVDIYGLDGKLAAQMQSPTDAASLNNGGLRKIQVSLDPLLLGSGIFLLSIAVYDLSDEAENIGPEMRYDMLTRSYQLTVTAPTDSDPPRLHYPAVFSFGTTDNHVSSLVRGA